MAVRLTLSLAMCAVVTLLAACGGGATSPQGSPSPGGGSGGTPAGTSTATAAPAIPSPCSLFTQADAATISGDQGVSTFTNSKYLCIYGAGDPANCGEQAIFSILPSSHATPDVLQGAAKANVGKSATFQQASGIGDLAYSFTADNAGCKAGGVVFAKGGFQVLLYGISTTRGGGTMAADAAPIAMRIAGQI